MVILDIPSQTSEAVEIIKAVGSTWPFVLTVFFILIVVLYRKPLVAYLTKTKNVSIKTPVAELTVDTITRIEGKPEAVLIEKDERDLFEEETNPKTQSEINNYISIFQALRDKNLEAAQKIFDERQSMELDAIQKEKNRLTFLESKFLYGGYNTIDELQALSDSYNIDELKLEGNRLLGSIFYMVNDYKNAEAKFKEAISLARSEVDKTNITISIAAIYSELGKLTEAKDLLAAILPSLSDKNSKKSIYQAISKIYLKQDDWLLRSVSLEMALVNDPSNTELLFDAGFAYSGGYKNTNSQSPVMALMHYRDLLSFSEKSQGGFNNIGVAYSYLDLKGYAVENYKKAADMGNALAAANLANNNINSGFYAEAKALLENAAAKEDVHENVWSSLADLAKKQKDEKIRREELLNIATKSQNFIRQFGELFFLSLPADINYMSIYKNNSHELTFKQLLVETNVELAWTNDQYNFSAVCSPSKIAFKGSGTYFPKGGGIGTNFSALLYFSDNKNTINILVLSEGYTYKLFIFQFTTQQS